MKAKAKPPSNGSGGPQWFFGSLCPIYEPDQSRKTDEQNWREKERGQSENANGSGKKCSDPSPPAIKLPQKKRRAFNQCTGFLGYMRKGRRNVAASSIKCCADQLASEISLAGLEAGASAFVVFALIILMRTFLMRRGSASIISNSRPAG